MRILVCGARDYTNKARIFGTLDSIHEEHHVTCVIEGGAKGADSMARDWAIDRGLPVQTYPADWQKYGRAAGPIRNKEMLDRGEPDVVVAFPKTTLENSLGTRNMVDQARKRDIDVWVYDSLWGV